VNRSIASFYEIAIPWELWASGFVNPRRIYRSDRLSQILVEDDACFMQTFSVANRAVQRQIPSGGKARSCFYDHGIVTAYVQSRLNGIYAPSFFPLDPKRNHILAIGADRMLRVFDMSGSSPTEIRRLETRGQFIVSCEFNDRPAYAIATDEGDLLLCDYKSFAVIMSIRIANAVPRALFFYAPSNFVILQYDYELFLYAINRGAILDTLVVKDITIIDQFGDFLIYASRSGIISKIFIGSGRFLPTEIKIHGHNSQISGFAFAPTVWTACSFDGLVLIRDYENRVLMQFNSPFPILCCTFLNSRMDLLLATPSDLFFLSCANFRLPATADIRSPLSLVLDPSLSKERSQGTLLKGLVSDTPPSEFVPFTTQPSVDRQRVITEMLTLASAISPIGPMSLPNSAPSGQALKATTPSDGIESVKTPPHTLSFLKRSAMKEERLARRPKRREIPVQEESQVEPAMEAQAFVPPDSSKPPARQDFRVPEPPNDPHISITKPAEPIVVAPMSILRRNSPVPHENRKRELTLEEDKKCSPSKSQPQSPKRQKNKISDVSTLILRMARDSPPPPHNSRSDREVGRPHASMPAVRDPRHQALAQQNALHPRNSRPRQGKHGLSLLRVDPSGPSSGRFIARPRGRCAGVGSFEQGLESADDAVRRMKRIDPGFAKVSDPAAWRGIPRRPPSVEVRPLELQSASLEWISTLANARLVDDNGPTN
jgi:WD40 repeat protein